LNVLVDTDVWSEALRKTTGAPSLEVLAFRELLLEGRVQLIGPIRQEVLSGLRDSKRFLNFREVLRDFLDATLETPLYELAAEFMNKCRAKGIQGSQTDFLICACSVVWQMPVLTKDQDYRNFLPLVPVRLFEV
jgi:predicted nucleic acid-binding protein